MSAPVPHPDGGARRGAPPGGSRRSLPPSMLLGGAILLGLHLAALLAPLLAPYDPARIDLLAILEPPSPAHLLGTDENGRDVLSRLLFGARVSLSVGLLAAIEASVLGTLIGAVSGFYGGWVDALIMRLVDLLLSVPTFFLLLVIAAIFRPNLYNIVLIIGLTSWMGVARLVRGEFLSLKGREFVDAGRALGVGDARLIFRHLLPHALAPVIVATSLMVGGAILLESTLSFLGLGVQAPAASWGSMLANSQEYIWKRPLLTIFPGFLIFLTVVSYNFVGDGLRRFYDPRGARASRAAR